MDKNNRGVSLIEVLLVMAILLLIIAGAYFAMRAQVGKGQDAKRKDDLERIKVAFEDYYNDNGCYPTPDMIENCDSDKLSPYLNRIPCDPVSCDPYKMVTDQYGGDACPTWYKVYTKMENTDDVNIVKLGCQDGCQIDGDTYHYGISSPNVYAGQVPASSFTCSDGTPGTAISKSCGGDYINICNQCTCSQCERIQCPEGLSNCYCCPDDSCYGCGD